MHRAEPYSKTDARPTIAPSRSRLRLGCGNDNLSRDREGAIAGGRPMLLSGRRRGRVGLTRDVELLFRMKEFEVLADLQLLGGGVALQTIDIVLLTLDLPGEAVVALFHFLDLPLLVLPGTHSLGKGEEGITHRHQEDKHISESGQWRFHATIEPEDNISINILR